MAAVLSADYLIIGSGIAGLRAAIGLARHGRVLILTKADRSAGSTGYAQGGIAAAVGAGDTAAKHAQDTVAAGDGLADEAAVRVLVNDGPRYVHELIEWGAAFDFDAAGVPALAREGAHSVRRVLHAHDATGREIGRVLAAELLRRGNVKVIDHALLVGFAIEEERVAGVRFLDRDGVLQTATASATLLATGGAGQVYQETTNPPVASGDGMAVAYFAGARVMDLEFVQFHPTALAVPGMPRYLLSEALRGEGARLVNAAGESFMSRYETAGDLASRDRVSRAIVLERARTGGPVYLTLEDLPPDSVRARFPLITELCRRAGLDLARDRIPVGPAAHYMMGGVATDLDGRTSLPGLFAAGEVACTGVHGANRLASNSLLEGLVFGARAGLAMSDWRATDWPSPQTPMRAHRRDGGPRGHLPISEAEVRQLMWQAVGVFRDATTLRSACAALDDAWVTLEKDYERGATYEAEGWRLLSLVTVGRLIAHAALRREETRGAHARTDFPAKDELHFKRHLSDVRSHADVER